MSDIEHWSVMWRKNFTRFSVALMLPLFGGCLPATFTRVPEVSGRVIAPDGKPLAGAELRIAQMSPEKREWMLRADENGNFRQKELVSWVLAPLLPLDALGPKFELTAKYDERSSDPIPFGGGLYHPHYLGLGNPAPRFDLGDVRIR